ncbi:eukaryotic translation initiation factor eIF1-like [Drosophila pseudoobscura]|uniref:Eukaryotic translation initiation factor eIF1-like n=1 Tax=Drosophila pseudoobscura pseudoobscura TaxID=46245 RepID=A0A6I8VW94_DROPS|nr:eukaryotic translation initiation factor eIF1 [Drosophila pseudoobscura]
MSIQNLHTRDPFAEAEAAAAIQARPVHIRLQQRNGGRTITTVQGLSSGYDLKKVVRCCKKEFACNGTLLESPEYGQVIQLQGDQRLKIHQWLTKMQLASSDQLKVCGL